MDDNQYSNKSINNYGWNYSLMDELKLQTIKTLDDFYLLFLFLILLFKYEFNFKKLSLFDIR